MINMRFFVCLAIIYLGTVCMLARPHLAMKSSSVGDDDIIENIPNDLNVASRQLKVPTDFSDANLSSTTTNIIQTEFKRNGELSLPENSIKRMDSSVPISRKLIKSARDEVVVDIGRRKVYGKIPTYWSDGSTTYESKDYLQRNWSNVWNKQFPKASYMDRAERMARKRAIKRESHTRLDQQDPPSESSFEDHIKNDYSSDHKNRTPGAIDELSDATKRERSMILDIDRPTTRHKSLEETSLGSGGLHRSSGDIQVPLESSSFVGDLDGATRKEIGLSNSIQQRASDQGAEIIRGQFGQNKRTKTMQSDETTDLEY